MAFATEARHDTELFERLSRRLLSSGHTIRFQAQGHSMFPAIRHGETLQVEAVPPEKLHVGDIVVARTGRGIRAHRLIFADKARDCFLMRGDNNQESDSPVGGQEILGRVILGRRSHLRQRMHAVKQTLKKGLRLRQWMGTMLFLVAVAGLVRAQVVFDATANGNGSFTTSGAHNFTFNHTTTAAANRLMVVGVSINTVNSAASVTSITYGAQSLVSLGAHNDAGTSRRVEIWYLKAPAAGTATVTVNVTQSAGVRVGFAAGSMTFSGVDQTVPLSGMVSNDGAAATPSFSQLDIPSGTNQMVFEVVAVERASTVTAGPSQIQRWSTQSTGGGNATGNVRGAGSTNAGAASVPMSETFSAASNWSIAGASVLPLQADVGVSINPGGAVPSGTNLTYTITVTNNGPTTATGVTLTDTLAAGLTLVSATPTQGTCSGTGPISCPLGNLAGGASATIVVVASAAQSGSYANTASVTATQPDLNTGNNSYTAVGIVQSNACVSPPNLVAGGTLTGVVNTYYPATASVTAGTANTTIPVGTARGAAATIANGDLLLVMQMQDASINSSNSSSYGNGATGAGFTAINNSGNYEFVKATGAISGGAIPISGAGLNNGLIYSYTNAAATGTKGKSTYQVIRVPQYSTATLGAGLTALAWDGSSGGVLALDIAGALTLGSATVSVDGLGFRGAAGLQLQGLAGSTKDDYRFASPTAYTGAAIPGAQGGKGEGVAGTPRWVATTVTPFFLDTNIDGYPNGGMARGAPGDAGGGGTDGDPQTASPNGNDENSGAGGGGNGGTGGSGGNSWNSTLGIGGLGGAPFPSTLGRIALGGGGGAGTRNNSPGENRASSGGAGGGIIFIRAGSLTGSATLTANGAAAFDTVTNDAGGGGGAGGTVVVLSAGGGEAGLTVRAQGGKGGNADTSVAFALDQRHGPGGGGAGGVVYLSGAASINVNGGANGVTLNPGVAYGATPGSNGTSVTNAQISQGSGDQSGAGCVPNVTIAKTHAPTTFVRGSSASYQLTVSNVSPFGSTNGLVTVNDTLPLGVVPTIASGAGWTCTIALQTVSCTRSDALGPANAAYPPIAITATVTQSAPATVVNNAIVSGGGEIDLSNDIATDTAPVGSTSDLGITNTATPNPVGVGVDLVYTQTITNSGPSDATSVTLSQTIPANTTLRTLTPPAGWTCAIPGPGGTLVCTASDMPPGTAVFSVIVRVNPLTPNGTVITDTVQVSSAVSDPNVTNNRATATTIVGTAAQPDLSVSNSASPNPVLPGNNITYTQVVTNTGSAAATTATYLDTVPLNTTFQSFSAPVGWTCSTPAVGGTGNVTCTNPSVAGASSGTFQLQVRVNPLVAGGTVITNTVTVNAANDANAGDNSATVTDLVATATQADLALTTAVPSFVIAGNNLIYTQTIANNGPAAASTVTFLQATPPNTTFRAVLAPTGWSCTTPAVGGTGNISCTNTSLAAGSVANITVTVNVNAPTANATVITATSSLSSTTSDPSAANNSTSVTTTVNAVVNLAVTNSGTPSPVTAGNDITYTQTVTNTGPSNAASVVFLQATPANTVFRSLISPGLWACTTPAVNGTGNIRCTLATMAPGTTASFTVVVRVPVGTPAGTIITDTPTVSTASHDTVAGDNSATVNIAVGVAGQADLRVTNVGTPDPVTAGNNITYTQVAANSGPANAVTAVFTGATPPNTTFVSLPAPAGWACPTLPPVGGTGAISCNIAIFNNGATATFVLTVKVNSNTPNGTLITDTASVSAATADPNPGNNSASSSIAVGTSADMSITNSDVPDPVIAGNSITYTQVLTNPGPSNDANVTLTGTTPANTNFQSLAAPGGWACTTPAVGATGAISCTNASFAPGTATFTLALQVNAGTAAGTTITDTVSVTSATDTNTSNNTASTTTTVATAGQADLSMTNSPSASSVPAGSNVTYTQTVKNNGPASASTLTFTETIPANTTFQGIAAGAWSCVTPAVGGTGTITCTLATLAAGNSSAISVTLQVNSNTPSGTVIGDTASVSAATGDPNAGNSSATANVTVGTGTNADLSITKTASPSPVAQGNLLTYTLTVTNGGPAGATNVTVVDVLPSVLRFVSVSTNAGSCSAAANIVTCQVGTLANAGTATINIVVTPLSSTIVTNSAMVTADQTDAASGNNIGSVTTLVTAPTRIDLQSFTAEGSTQGTVLRWRTGGELNNLGFNVYREQNGERIRLNPTLVAGSALMMSGYLEKHAARSYAWIDPAGTPSSMYWLEDIDLNCERTLHGPVSPSVTASSSSVVSSMTMAQLAKASAQSGSSHIVEYRPQPRAGSQASNDQQFNLAAHPAVKIMVDHEGWYRVGQPDLVAAGLDPSADPAMLRLFVEAAEQPILITGAGNGPGGFGPGAAIEFYGTGIDTPFTGTRVYWLVAGDQPGLRISNSNELPSGKTYVQQFSQTVELRQRTTYFAAFINSKDDNFFGDIVTTTPTDQIVGTPHVVMGKTAPRLEVALQGVGDGVPHDVTVALNDGTIGEISFTGQTKGLLRVDLPQGALLDGANRVTLTAHDGDSDISLVDHITISYPQTIAANAGQVKFAARAGAPVQIGNFAETSVRLFDITDANQPIELATHMVAGGGGTYAAQARVPFSPSGRHILMALGASNISSPSQLVANQPSQWHAPQVGSDVVMITAPAFADALTPLVDLRRQQGHTVSVVLTDDIYDEFSFGEHSPQAIRDFLKTASANWTTKPKYLLLAGDASVDPRNFLGFGNFDFVPTRVIPTSQLMTASDDWFSDFTNVGVPALATGRLPIRTVDEARTVVAKIVNYEAGGDSGAWTGQALLIADRNDNADFVADTQAIAKLLPPSIQPTEILAGNLDPGTARAEVRSALNAGQLLVNYLGHGSIEVWSGDDLLDDRSAAALTNAPRLPVYMIFDCLNGFFHDVYTDSLAEVLLLNPNGGAVAVIASSALTDAQPQAQLDRQLVSALVQKGGTAVGDALVQAKAGIKTKEVRRTYLLLGDPLLRLKAPAGQN